MRQLFLLILTTTFAQAQFTYTIDQSVPVVINKDTLRMAWAGGLNSAQFNTMDLNGDGKDDLVLFDRTANRIITFLNTNNQYTYNPEYEVFFPEDIYGFVLLRDFNCDGKKDLFTRDPLGMRVFKNTTPDGGTPSWDPYLFFTGSQKTQVLLTQGSSGKINLQLQPDDLPAIVDYDGDGDLDIISPRYPQGSTFELHKNLSIEKNWGCDSLEFTRVTQKWGDIEECTCGVFAFGTNCSTGGRTQHAGGKGLLAIDIDNDQDIDLLFSEAECARVYLFRNDGDNDNPVVNAAALFPSPNPIGILLYPTVFFEDVDFDDKKDLIATPGLIARDRTVPTDFMRSTQFYKNTGTNQLPSFSFQLPNFLQRDMIDLGDNSVPAFYDADGDGDLDLIIGTSGNGSRASLYYFENVGTRTEPAYELITDNFLGLSFANFTNIKPQFADVNGDTKIDLVFTASNVFWLNTNVFYILNNNNVGLNFTGQQIQSLNFPIFSSENVLVTHINNDFLPDLLVGKFDGSIQYWQNTGTPALPTFSLTNAAYLGIGTSTLRQNLSLAVGDLNSDGLMDLLIGDQNGSLSVISNFKGTDSPSEIKDIVFNPITETYQSQNLGGRIWPQVANIFSTNNPAIILGNTLGGLHILKHDDSLPLPETPQIELFPNPVFTEESPILNIRVDRPALAYVLTVTGQEVGAPLFLQGQQTYQFSVTGLKAGLYLVRFIINGKSYTKRLVIAQ